MDFDRFGSGVTVIELAPGLIAREDADVSEAVTAILKNERIDVHVETKCLLVERHGRDMESVAGESIWYRDSQITGPGAPCSYSRARPGDWSAPSGILTSRALKRRTSMGPRRCGTYEVQFQQWLKHRRCACRPTPPP